MRVPVGRTFRALRHRNYRLFFVGQGLSLIGTWLQQVAMSWLVYRLTGSAWLLGVVAFCANVGILLFSNVAGISAPFAYCHPPCLNRTSSPRMIRPISAAPGMLWTTFAS